MYFAFLMEEDKLHLLVRIGVILTGQKAVNSYRVRLFVDVSFLFEAPPHGSFVYVSAEASSHPWRSRRDFIIISVRLRISVHGQFRSAAMGKSSAHTGPDIRPSHASFRAAAKDNSGVDMGGQNQQ